MSWTRGDLATRLLPLSQSHRVSSSENRVVGKRQIEKETGGLVLGQSVGWGVGEEFCLGMLLGTGKTLSRELEMQTLSHGCQPHRGDNGAMTEWEGHLLEGQPPRRQTRLRNSGS